MLSINMAIVISVICLINNPHMWAVGCNFLSCSTDGGTLGVEEPPLVLVVCVVLHMIVLVGICWVIVME